MSIILICLGAFLMYCLQMTVYRRQWYRQLEVGLRFQAGSMYEGEENHLKEVIENRKRLPLPMVKVKFQTSRRLQFEDSASAKVTDRYYRNDVFHIGGREKITRTLAFRGGKRGYYRIENLDIIGADLFMSSEMLVSNSCNAAVYVYPKPYEEEEFQSFLQQANGEVLTRRHLLEDPFEYRGIREYQPYDTMKAVNWKATARTGELKVNEKNYTALNSVRIFLNPEDKGILREEDTVEAAIRMAAGLAGFFLKQGIQTSFYSNGRDCITGLQTKIEAGAGPGQMDAVNRALARLDTDREAAEFAEEMEPILMQTGSDTMTFLVALHAYDGFLSAVRAYEESGKSYMWLYPARDREQVRLPQDIRERVHVICTERKN